MERIYVSEVKPETANTQVKVAGWAFDIRDLGGLKFILLRDKSGTIQVTLPKKVVSPELFKLASDLTKESVIEVEGMVQAAKQAPTGVEIIPSKIFIHSKAEAPIPIDMTGKANTDLSVRLDYRFLDLRSPKGFALFKIRSRVFENAVDYFRKEGFMNLNTPKITSAGVESGAELFPVVYFDKQAFLSQSPQIYKQMFVCAGFEKVYEFGPVFRAEKSHTTRHLTEFTGIDFELGFVKDENDAMDVIEKMFQHVLTEIKKECHAELAMFNVDPVVPKKIPRIPMDEAKKLLEAKGKKLPADEDLDPEGEKILGEIVKQKYGEDFVFVTLYPYKKRPFYHMKPEGKADLTKSFDLLYNGLEISTGAQREHRYEILKAQAKEKGLDLDKMKDYANIFKYGAPSHAGAGLGLDRIVESLLKLDNIREGILLPRDPLRLTP